LAGATVHSTLSTGGGIDNMIKFNLRFFAGLLAAVFTATVLPPTLAHAQSKTSSDEKDVEIELLKSEVKRLEQRVDTLEGLDRKVKVIDREVQSQAAAQHVQERRQKVETEIEEAKFLQMPIVKASDEGFAFSTPNEDYRIRFAGNIQANTRVFH
jgi:hypothetical protein